MSIYVALTQIKVSDESGLRHTASQADLRRRAAAPAAEAARAAMAIPAARHSYTPFRIRTRPRRRWRGHEPARARRTQQGLGGSQQEPGGTQLGGLAEPGEAQAD